MKFWCVSTFLDMDCWIETDVHHSPVVNIESLVFPSFRTSRFSGLQAFVFLFGFGTNGIWSVVYHRFQKSETKIYAANKSIKPKRMSDK